MASESIIGQAQTVSPGVFSTAVREAARLPDDFMRANAHRIDRAYRYGETIAMIVEELRMIYSIRSLHRPTKSPRELAVRVVRLSSTTN